jgi:hypothetical protein
MPYFADAIIDKCIRWGQSPILIGVIESPNDRVPIGIAREVRETDAKASVWSISIHGVAVPGSFTVVDGEFVPIEAGLDCVRNTNVKATRVDPPRLDLA